MKAILDAYNPKARRCLREFHNIEGDALADRSSPVPRSIGWFCDQDWEAEFCRVAEAHPEVRAYVKNQNLGLEVPYLCGSQAAEIPAGLHRPGG